MLHRRLTALSAHLASGVQRRFLNRACGIVGMPNVGKSTLFNALTRTQRAEAANYPFCTIKPNSASVSVRDDRLRELALIAKSEKVGRVPRGRAEVGADGDMRSVAGGEARFRGHRCARAGWAASTTPDAETFA